MPSSPTSSTSTSRNSGKRGGVGQGSPAGTSNACKVIVLAAADQREQARWAQALNDARKWTAEDEREVRVGGTAPTPKQARGL